MCCVCLCSAEAEFSLAEERAVRAAVGGTHPDVAPYRYLRSAYACAVWDGPLTSLSLSAGSCLLTGSACLQLWCDAQSSAETEAAAPQRSWRCVWQCKSVFVHHITLSLSEHTSGSSSVLCLKGIVHFEIKMWYLSAYPKGIQDVGVFFSSVDPILMFLGQTVLVCQSYNGRYRSLSL